MQPLPPLTAQTLQPDSTRTGQTAYARRRLAALTGAATLALGLGAATAWAQPQLALYPPPQNLVTLDAEASTEVLQDRLSIVLSVTREGTDASLVQSQLRQVLDAALLEARKSVRPGQLEVRTGSFSLYARYNAKPGGGNQISGWQGRGELVLEGRDTAGISQLAGRLAGMTVQQVSFGLSREAREKAEAEVAAQAIAAFKARAERYAQAFGFASYSLREVSVGGGAVLGQQAAPMVRMSARAMAAPAADESQPVEAGKATVSVTVSGSIQLSPR